MVDVIGGFPVQQLRTAPQLQQAAPSQRQSELQPLADNRRLALALAEIERLTSAYERLEASRALSQASAEREVRRLNEVVASLRSRLAERTRELQVAAEARRSLVEAFEQANAMIGPVPADGTPQRGYSQGMSHVWNAVYRFARASGWRP